jgi:hypothetical protein
MKRMIIAVAILLAAGLSSGCNKRKDWVSSDGTKMYGDLALHDGTRRLVRIEYPDGHSEFDITTLPDGSEKIRRIEYPNNGPKDFDVIRQNGFYKVVRREFRDGEKQFNVTQLPGGTQKIELSELPNGEKDFDVVLLQDHTAKIGRVEFADGEKRFDVTRLPDGSEKVDLEFRGLRAGQSREEVEAVLKQQDSTTSLDCGIRNPNGSVSCDPDSISFSRDGKLVHFQIPVFSHGGENSESFLSSLRQELATVNHKEGEAESPGNDPLSKLAANMGIRSFTWDTPQKAVCLWDQEKECPAQQITLTEHHQCSSYDGRCMAFVELTDNAFLTEGWVKKDKNRPQPRVANDIVFMGLDGGEQRSQVDTALQKQGYKPLSCKYDREELEHDCKTSSGSHRFELSFVHDHLSFFHFYYSAQEHDAVYQNLVNSLGQPTDFSGKPGEGVYSWMTERTIPCANENGNAKQCTADLLMLSSEEVSYADSLLENLKVREKTVRMLKASHPY